MSASKTVDASSQGAYNSLAEICYDLELSVASETGKRYFCASCGCEFIVTKGGDGTLICHGEPLTKK